MGSVVTAHRLSYPQACGILVPHPGTEPTSPAFEGRFLTPGLPGKSLFISLLYKEYFVQDPSRAYFPHGSGVKNLPVQGHGFHPWPRKIPHAAEQLNPCTATTEPVPQSPQATATEPNCLDPVLCTKRHQSMEVRALQLESNLPLTATRESTHTAMKTQCRVK